MSFPKSLSAGKKKECQTEPTHYQPLQLDEINPNLGDPEPDL